ncbi:MAG: L-threonylcarbamoyladenylate synthase [Alphaproteobacteria bacterium]|nr:L-threonylcarbamoyladenylate synthase [Alphaproteobacteria bacterium]
MTDNTITEAARRILAGQIVAAPTETVYGLFGDATQDQAVAAIYALKNRPRQRPLILHVHDWVLAERVAVMDDRARALATYFWPSGRGGAISLVVPRRADYPLSPLVNHGGDKIALRIPDHPLALALIAAVGRPLAAPSANRFGRVSPTLAAHVREQFGAESPYILEGGACAIGVESTILDLTAESPVILRPGFIDAAAIASVIGVWPRENQPHDGSHNMPGSSSSHYAPHLPVRLDAQAALSGKTENLLAFGRQIPPGFAQIWQLSATGDLHQAAFHLYDYLRQADNGQATGIAVMPIPGHGIGLAINDRLRRAAAR